MVVDLAKTYLPVSALLACIMTFVGASWWMSALYSRVVTAESNISDLQKANYEMLKQLQDANYTLVEIKTILKQNRVSANSKKFHHESE